MKEGFLDILWTSISGRRCNVNDEVVPAMLVEVEDIFADVVVNLGWILTWSSAFAKSPSIVMAAYWATQVTPPTRNFCNNAMPPTERNFVAAAFFEADEELRSINDRNASNNACNSWL